ncbi:MAG: hypothetical protein WCA15_18305 [Candidatus Acidiferrales bacterium]
MPYEFTDRDYEPEPQASSSRGGIPPQKIAGVGLLDPPVPPKKQPVPLPHVPASPLQRILAAIVLAAIAIFFALMIFAQR